MNKGHYVGWREAFIGFKGFVNTGTGGALALATANLANQTCLWQKKIIMTIMTIITIITIMTIISIIYILSALIFSTLEKMCCEKRTLLLQRFYTL